MRRNMIWQLCTAYNALGDVLFTKHRGVTESSAMKDLAIHCLRTLHDTVELEITELYEDLEKES